MYAKTGRWKFAEEQYIDIVSKYLPTKCCKLAELIPISVLVMGWPCWLEITQHPCVCHHLRLWCPVENEANYLPTNYEGKYRNFIVEKSRVHHFNQMIQVNVAHKETHQHHMPLDKMHRGHRIASAFFEELLESHHEDTSDRPTLRVIL